MIEDEFEGRGPVAVALAVFALPLRGEAKIRAAMLAGTRRASGAGGKLLQVVLWSLAWLAYVPAIVLFEAAAVPLVGGSLLLAAGLCLVAMVVVTPVLLALWAVRQRRQRPRTYSAPQPAAAPLEA